MLLHTRGSRRSHSRWLPPNRRPPSKTWECGLRNETRYLRYELSEFQDLPLPNLPLQGWSRSLMTPASPGRGGGRDFLEGFWSERGAVSWRTRPKVKASPESDDVPASGICHVTCLGIGLGLQIFAFYDFFMIISCGNIVTIVIQSCEYHVAYSFHIQIIFNSYSVHFSTTST